MFVSYLQRAERKKKKKTHATTKDQLWIVFALLALWFPSFHHLVRSPLPHWGDKLPSQMLLQHHRILELLGSLRGTKCSS